MSDNKTKYFWGVGRRKRATARAKYFPTGSELNITVNKKKITEYFIDYYYQTILSCLNNLGINSGQVDLYIGGGGIMGQAEAARLAISKALLAQDEGRRPVLKIYQYLSTDIRKVLPKRSGLRKARKREQWSKR